MLAEAVTCLALNIYFEARNQSTIGQIAVAQVTMNRVVDERFPDTVCEVVKQGITYKNSDKPVPHKCQFSWYCDGKSDEPKNDKAWHKALYVAGVVPTVTLDITEGATHYHATYVRPDWARTKTKTARIGRHIFYRWEK